MPKYEIICAECGHKFVSLWSNTLYCGPTCANAARSRRAKQAAVERALTGATVRVATCDTCGEEFRIAINQSHARYCSKLCRSRAKCAREAQRTGRPSRYVVPIKVKTLPRKAPDPVETIETGYPEELALTDQEVHAYAKALKRR